MKRLLVLVAVVTAAAAGVLVLTGFTSGQQQFRGTVYIGMDAPLTGPQAIVGQGDREAVNALVRYWNRQGGINRRRVVVDILDNASNPSQAVQNVQRFVADRKYVAILGSGNAAAAVATAPLATEGRIPFLALSPPTPLISPAPRPYVYVALPTDRLYAYSMARYLRSLRIQRIALIGDNGGFGRGGIAQVKALARAYGFTITDEIVFAPTQTSFAAELSKVRNSDAQALWVWTVTPPGATIVKEFRQLRLPQRLVLTGGNLSQQFLEATCPDVNGALVNSFLGVVWQQLPRNHPSRRQAQLVQRLVGKPISVFHVDASTSFFALKAAMERGGFTREAINTALETKLRRLPTPGGRLYFGPRNHSGVQMDSMWAGRIAQCKPRALFGASFQR
ncbi:MAG TPA: ABC transporter substrate-binding protein [Gemmatimonadota bacterium]|nr:ABC transporter substrate-binding protein [Gemmatimonadota bacterium]